jgi:hypothetical protein
LLVTDPSKIAAFAKTNGILALAVDACSSTLSRRDSLSLEVRNRKYPEFQLECP